jgi:hypothetical protein
MLAVAASLGLNFAVIVAGSIALVAALPLMSPGTISSGYEDRRRRLPDGKNADARGMRGSSLGQLRAIPAPEVPAKSDPRQTLPPSAAERRFQTFALSPERAGSG